jgi:protoporphyrinogen oxidase
MSASKKLIGTDSGQPETAMQKLKAVWLRLPEATQDYWREQFSSSRKQTELRAEIGRKLSVHLPTDSKLTKFRDWLADQDQRDAQAERMEENTRRLQKEHPDWTLDQVREEVLRQSYFETLASGDFKTGLQTVSAHSKVEALKFDQEKFKEGLRSKLEAGLAELAAHIKGNPAAKKAYDAFRATIKESTK